MNTDIEARLERIIRKQTEATGYPVRAPAPQAAIDALAEAVKSEFAVTVPDTLREFWSRHDGLRWDDYELYRVVPTPGNAWPDDVLSESRACRTDFGTNYVAIGTSSISLYGFNCDTGQWTVSSKDGLDVFEAFDPGEFDAYFSRLLDIFINDPSPEDAEIIAQFEAEHGFKPF